jgi:dihydroceramidase
MSIWGETSGEFDPLRWEIATREQLEAFLPFGSKPFECPARPLFGPRLIGLLVGTLLRAFPQNWTLTLESSIDSVEFGPERLSNERSGFHDLYLI